MKKTRSTRTLKNKTTSKASKKFKKIMKFIGKMAGTCALVFAITGTIVVTVLTVYVLKFVDTEAEGIMLEDLPYNYTTIVYAKDSKTDSYVEAERIHSKENRIWVNIDKLPDYVGNAFIAVEDERFLKHEGVDWKRTVAAFANLFIPFSNTQFGGSTITQQVIKNITLDDQHSIERKIKEIFRAIDLEKRYSKQEILEAYINTIHLGNNTNGVQAAANLYFNKDAADLTIAEAATLAATTKFPSSLNPIKNYEKNQSQAEYIIDKMYELGFIASEEERDNAIAEEVLVKTPDKTDSDNPNAGQYGSYFVDAVIEDVIADLMNQKGYTYEYAESMINVGGLRIYTTMDQNLQKTLENKFKESSTFPKTTGAVAPEAAFILMDYNGNIKALVGGRGEKTTNRGFNRATQAVRQPGSTIKPIAVYGPAMEYNKITWSTIINDSPITIEGGKKWPVNYYGAFYGNMTVAEALQRSTNTVAVKVCQELTPKFSFDYIESRLGISTLVRSKKIENEVHSDITLGSMALGAMTEGVTLRDMAGAYQIFGNGGFYNKPITYSRVETSSGEVILENTPDPTRVISDGTYGVMNKLLQTVFTSSIGTARGGNFSDMPVAGKTGTTTDNKDYWFCGLSPYYVGITWYGYDTPKNLTVSFSTVSTWRKVMGPLHSGLPIIDFPDSDQVEKHVYCKETGLLANDNCTATAEGYYKKDNMPDVCTKHQ